MNKHGLSRDIPHGVEGEVRRRCKFSCILCDSGLYHFHHFDPPFAEAIRHDPNGITLLCGTCHDYVERGLKSNAEIVEADRRRVNETPVANVFLSVQKPFYTVLGSLIFPTEGPLVTHNGQPVLAVTASELGKLEITADLIDINGQSRLLIEDNAIRIHPDSWDVKVQGPVIRMWSKPKSVFAEIVLHPPNGIHIRDFAIRLGNWIIDTRERGRFSARRIESDNPENICGGIFAAGAIVSEGPLCLNQEGFSMGPSCIDMSYDSKRLYQLADEGKMSQLIREITGPRPRPDGGLVKIQIVPPQN